VFKGVSLVDGDVVRIGLALSAIRAASALAENMENNVPLVGREG
jgi:hypothetical protein